MDTCRRYTPEQLKLYHSGRIRDLKKAGADKEAVWAHLHEEQCDACFSVIINLSARRHIRRGHTITRPLHDDTSLGEQRRRRPHTTRSKFKRFLLGFNGVNAPERTRAQ